MIEKKWSKWDEFRINALSTFAATPLDRRDHWWFRGQSNVAHTLLPSIDRGRTFSSDADREAFIGRLLREFRAEAMLVTHSTMLPESNGFELLARHHGLPSPLLDFTRAPWIAVYFAYAGWTEASGDHVTVYAINRTKIPSTSLIAASSVQPPLELIDDSYDLRFNRRALQQKGAFLRVSTADTSVEALLADSLVRWLLPSNERDRVLAELDSMLLNATALMYDLDGAARTATQRLGQWRL